MPDWWSILKVDGKSQGVLLFNRAADGNTIELVYLGMSRSVRGRGLGRLLLTNGLAGLDNADGRAARSRRRVAAAGALPVFVEVRWWRRRRW